MKRERHLRLTAENDAAATAAAVESERMRTLARDAEDAAYLQMKVGAVQCHGHIMRAVFLQLGWKHSSWLLQGNSTW